MTADNNIDNEGIENNEDTVLDEHRLASLSKSLDKVKIQFMQQKSSTFLTTILFSLKIQWDINMEKPGVNVNGEYIKIHPDYWESLSLPQQISVLAHEAWHVALEHVVNIEMPGINRERYQEAADQVVNNLLQQASYELPPEAICDSQYKNMSTMQVYSQIMKNNPPNNNDNNNGGNGGGINNDIASPEGGTGFDNLQQLKNKIQDMNIKANTMAQMSGDKAGDLPGELELKIDEILNPKLDWRTLLQKYFAAFVKEDYSFQRPNRRFMPDFYLPGLHGEGLGHIGVAYDTSGSVYESEFAAFMTESDDIRETLKPKLTSAVDFDTTIKHVHKLTADQPMRELPFSGRGGTNLTCVFDHFNKTENRPDVLIVFSDLECHPREEEPPYPVIWVCINNPDAEVKFGKLIHYETEQVDY